MKYANSGDQNRRASAVYFVADKDHATADTERILLDAFGSGVPRLQATALQGAIRAALRSKNPRIREFASDISLVMNSFQDLKETWFLSLRIREWPNQPSITTTRCSDLAPPHDRYGLNLRCSQLTAPLIKTFYAI